MDIISVATFAKQKSYSNLKMQVMGEAIDYLQVLMPNKEQEEQEEQLYPVSLAEQAA